jgi:hypothetical protein
MRKRIERNIDETLEFFENMGWDIGSSEKGLIKSSDNIDKYRNIHGGLGGEFTQKIEKVINFFYEPKPESDYKDWIGEDCVFSDEPFGDIINSEVYQGILVYFNRISSRFTNNYQNSYEYCMLKKDYVKLIKEQSK